MTKHEAQKPSDRDPLNHEKPHVALNLEELANPQAATPAGRDADLKRARDTAMEQFPSDHTNAFKGTDHGNASRPENFGNAQKPSPLTPEAVRDALSHTDNHTSLATLQAAHGKPAVNDAVLKFVEDQNYGANARAWLAQP